MLNLAIEDVHPPLYYIALKGWTWLFGITDFSMRSLSAMFGIALVPLAYLLTKELSNNKLTPYLVCTVIACNPFLIDYSQEARSYSMLAFLVLLSGYFLYKAMSKSPLKFNIIWLAFSFSLSVGFLTHYIFSFGVLSMALILLGYLKYRNLFSRENIMKVAILVTKVSIIPAITFLLWFPTLKPQIGTANLWWVPEAQFSFIPRSLYAFLFGVDIHAWGVPPVNEVSRVLSSDIISFIGYTLLIAVGIYVLIKSRNKISLVYPLLMGIIPIIGVIVASIYFKKNLYVERFLIGWGVFLILFMVTLISKIKNKTIVIAIIGFYLLTVIFMPKPARNFGYRELKAFMKNIDKTVVFADAGEFVVAKYYMGKKLSKQIKLYDFKHGNGFDSWVVIDKGEILGSLPLEPYVIVSHKPLDESVSRKVGEFHIYEDFQFKTIL